jgi:site-specific DNA-methyltransferase (adenine-specific)
MKQTEDGGGRRAEGRGGQAAAAVTPWRERREIGPCTLYLGDALAILPALEDESVDAIVTDPPYMVGAVSVGHAKAKEGTWADIENSAHWYALWIGECKRILRSSGYFAVFGNWRSLPTMTRAFSLVKMSITNAVVWDKQWIGPSFLNALRPRYEMVFLAAMPDAAIPCRSAPDIMSCKWMAGHMKQWGHPAEKPTALVRDISRLLIPAGGLILDPLMGSGTTGDAAARNGFRFIGIEREAEYFATACDRIAAAVADQATP